jgi:hypothetical protein
MYASKQHAVIVACDGRVVVEIEIRALEESAIQEAARIFDAQFSALGDIKARARVVAKVGDALPVIAS